MPVALVPEVVVAVMFTSPTDPAGDVTLNCSGDVTETLVAAVLAKLTVVFPATKPVPITVTTVPPDVGPEDGRTLVIVGGGG